MVNNTTKKEYTCMNDSKEKLISLVTQTMSENLTVEQLDMLIYTLSNVLQCYDISESKDLPSVDMDDTNKLIQNFLSCKKLRAVFPIPSYNINIL